MHIILPNTGRFSKFFHQQTQQKNLGERWFIFERVLNWSLRIRQHARGLLQMTEEDNTDDMSWCECEE